MTFYNKHSSYMNLVISYTVIHINCRKQLHSLTISLRDGARISRRIITDPNCQALTNVLAKSGRVTGVRLHVHTPWGQMDVELTPTSKHGPTGGTSSTTDNNTIEY